MTTYRKIVQNPWTLAAALAVSVGVWMLSGTQQTTAHTALAAASQPPAVVSRPEVQVRLQIAAPVTRHLEIKGRTAPARVVELAAETSGRVAAIGARRGERLTAGDLLARLDTRDRAARLAQARATVRQREIEYTSKQSLAPQGFVTEGEIAEAAALLEAARTELKRAELDLEYVHLRAPFDGALQDRHVEIGDYLAPGDPVATFVDDRTLIVIGSVAEREVRGLQPGQPAEARLVTGEQVSGRIRYVAPVADPATRTFAVELELDNADGDLPAGVTAEMRIPTETVYAHRISPALLTLDDEGQLGVKVVDALGVVAFYPAEIVRSEPDGVWVAGLPEASQIITVGQGFVKAGEAVSVPHAAEQARSAAFEHGPGDRRETSSL